MKQPVFRKHMLPLKSPHAVRTFLCGLALAAACQILLFAEREPPLRTGLWAMQKIPQNDRELRAFESRVRENSNLTGVCLHIGWNELEKESGNPDFSAIDKAVAVLHRVGKKYELGVKPGVDTPAFVFKEGAQSFETRIVNPYHANFGQATVIPVPWDPIYQRSFSRLIEQLGKRYGGDPLCVSVVLTCANFLSSEMHLPKTPMDRAKWKALGDYQAKLLEVYKKYTTEWGQAFPRQEISLHLTQVLDLPITFDEQILDYGISKYPERFTIQNCQLTGRKEDVDVKTYDLVQKYCDRVHHGFQSLAGFSGRSGRMGSIEMAALNVVHAKGEYWELWQNDATSLETSAAVAKAWQNAKRLGYDAYKKKLISENSYRQRE